MTRAPGGLREARKSHDQRQCLLRLLHFNKIWGMPSPFHVEDAELCMTKINTLGADPCIHGFARR
jgi:hypothetical protein